MDLRNLAHAVQNLSGLPIYVNDNAGNTLLDIKSFCRKLKAEQGLGLIVIDYLQLMKPHIRKTIPRARNCRDLKRDQRVGQRTRMSNCGHVSAKPFSSL
jgi:replicative DNA helicase